VSEATACIDIPSGSQRRTDPPRGPGEATHSTPVSKEHTHLRRADSVLLTDWTRRGPHEFLLSAQWPAAADDLPHDARVIAQLIRQSGLVIAHAAYDVPLSHQTLLHDFNYRVTPDFRAAQTALPLTVEVRVPDPKRAGRAVNALTMHIDIFHDGAAVARAEAAFSWVSPAAYRRLRGDHHTVAWAAWDVPEPVDATSVRRTEAVDVVLAPSEFRDRWLLRSDVTNTVLFDHPVDHVPGLVLIEAAQQAAHALGSPAFFEVETVTSHFDRYVEFDEPCWIEAKSASAADATTTTLVTGTQGGQCAFRIELTGRHIGGKH
jgi:hypothetical protein